jgi:hypothetical protein
MSARSKKPQPVSESSEAAGNVTEERSELARSGSNFTCGGDALDRTEILPCSTGQRAHYVSANIIWLPVDRMGVGLEYPEGHRKNKGGPRSENSHTQAGFRYGF